MDSSRAVSSKEKFDGVDYAPMPIGPVAFLGITLGGVFFGHEIHCKRRA